MSQLDSLSSSVKAAQAPGPPMGAIIKMVTKQETFCLINDYQVVIKWILNISSCLCIIYELLKIAGLFMSVLQFSPIIPGRGAV